MAQSTLRVSGYREFQGAVRRADKETRTEVRKAGRESGEIVRVAWRGRLELIDSRSAAGLRTRVRTRGVSVEQSIRRSTGERPDFGALQMRRGVDVLDEKQDEVVRTYEAGMDRVCDHFDNR